MLPQFISKPLENIIPFIPLDQKCYFMCLMSSYIFALIYFNVFVLKSRNSESWQRLKHGYILFVSHIFLLVCFKSIVLVHIYVPVVFTFISMKYFGKRNDRVAAPLLVFAIVIIHLAIHHLIRQVYFYNEYVLDHTAPMMIMAIKLTTFAFDIVDIETTTKDDSEFTLLEFLGYSFLFPGLLTGPCISFSDYRKFIDGRYFEGLDLSKPIYGRKRHACIRFLTSIIFLLIYIVTRDFFPCNVAIQDDFFKNPLWYQWLYIHISNIGWRAKYYFAWLNAEGAYAIIGLGFQKYAQSPNPYW
jgi:lysophospholipid acyltransferase